MPVKQPDVIALLTELMDWDDDKGVPNCVRTYCQDIHDVFHSASSSSYEDKKRMWFRMCAISGIVNAIMDMAMVEEEDTVH